jgi:hypothetical protein
METFVHGDIEVKKTGRTAEKPMPGGKKSVLVEITPVNDYDGTWKKWVSPSSLFFINPQTNSEREK